MPVRPQETMHPSPEAIVVECHSGHTYAQRPTAFLWEAERFEIATIDAEWRSPIGKHFRITTKNATNFELLYYEANDDWQIKPV